MNLKWFETFRRVVELQSYSRAAAVLGISQPTVSQQVRNLELQFAERLVIPTPRGIRVTEAGQKVYQAAMQLEAEIERVRREFARAAQGRENFISIACGPTEHCHYIPQLLKRLWRDHPNVSVRTVTLVGSAMTDAVLDGRVDVAIQTGSFLDPRLETLACMDDPVVLVCAPEHPLAVREQVSARDLVDVKVGLVSPPSSAGTVVLDWLLEQGVTLAEPVQFGSTEAVRAAALSGIVAGWVSHYAVEDDLANGHLRWVRLDGPRAVRHLYAAYKPEHRGSLERVLAVVAELHDERRQRGSVVGVSS